MATKFEEIRVGIGVACTCGHELTFTCTRCDEIRVDPCPVCLREALEEGVVEGLEEERE